MNRSPTEGESEASSALTRRDTRDDDSSADGSPSADKATPTAGEDPHAAIFAKTQFPSAKECRACHEKIYEEWSVSSHAFAYTRRWKDIVSYSVRYISNFGQDALSGAQSSDGHLFLLETSLISRNPWRLVPYCNLFAGFDRPQSLARAAVAGGVLRNTGINFETDGLTGFPTFDASGNDA